MFTPSLVSLPFSKHTCREAEVETRQPSRARALPRTSLGPEAGTCDPHNLPAQSRRVGERVATKKQPSESPGLHFLFFPQRRLSPGTDPGTGASRRLSGLRLRPEQVEKK